jgi:hypothetical protein
MRRHLVKSCCGSSGYVLELDEPITRDFIDYFKKEGYNISDTYTKVGVFYLERMGLTASGPFGSIKIQVRCGVANCNQLLDHLENTFEIIKSLKK